MTEPATDFERVCEALVLATQYLGAERNDEEHTGDDDLKVIESVAHLLVDATPAERDGLVAAARKLGLPDWARHIGLE